MGGPSDTGSRRAGALVRYRSAACVQVQTATQYVRTVSGCAKFSGARAFSARISFYNHGPSS